MIKIINNQARTAEYQRLLGSEWTNEFPETVLNLLWSAIPREPLAADKELLPLLDPAADDVPPAALVKDMLRQIQGVKKFVSISGLPDLPDDYVLPKRLSKVGWQAMRLSAYMILPIWRPLSGPVHVFHDFRSLAFHAALEFVLPTIRQKLPEEYAILLHSSVLLPLESFQDDPAHYCFLMSLIHEHLQNQDQRLSLLYSSFRFTPPEDHSFLTKAQDYWSELIDAGRDSDAEKFLYSLHLWALPEQQEEVREMMSEALRFMLRPGRNAAARLAGAKLT